MGKEDPVGKEDRVGGVVDRVDQEDTVGGDRAMVGRHVSWRPSLH